MNCPHCNHHKTKVTDSRNHQSHSNGKVELDTVVRYRRCPECHKSFKTIEQPVALAVVSGDKPIT